jgi:hypothetical protein
MSRVCFSCDRVTKPQKIKNVVFDSYETQVCKACFPQCLYHKSGQRRADFKQLSTFFSCSSCNKPICIHCPRGVVTQSCLLCLDYCIMHMTLMAVSHQPKEITALILSYLTPKEKAKSSYAPFKKFFMS